MLAWLQRCFYRLVIRRSMAKVARKGRGLFRRSWAMTADAGESERVRIAKEASDWLAAQLPKTVTPYGVNRFYVALTLLGGDAQRPAILNIIHLPPFSRLDSQAGLANLEDTLTNGLLLSEHPTLKELEIYLMSLGDLVHHTAREFEGQ